MPTKIDIFFDADALIAASASSSGAPFLLLQLCELGILHGVTSAYVIDECQKNLREKMPEAEPAFNQIVERSLHVNSDPTPDQLLRFKNMAHPKDLPVFTAAVLHDADFLVSFNTKDYSPSSELKISVCKPGELIQQIRKLLSHLVGN